MKKNGIFEGHAVKGCCSPICNHISSSNHVSDAFTVHTAVEPFCWELPSAQHIQIDIDSKQKYLQILLHFYTRDEPE